MSYVVAVFASYTALKTLGRIHASRGRERCWWLAGGALAMGIGVWSMHFVGMLAFRLPIPLGYDFKITAASLMFSVGASAYALWLLSRDEVSFLRLSVGAVVMGLGIAAMHYVGMHAMLMNPGIDYRPGLFVASVVIAILAAGTALMMAVRLRDDEARSRSGFMRIGAAMVMGLAIAGMHYTGMAAARFQDGAMCGAASAGGLSSDMLAMVVVLFNVAVLGTAISVSTLDRLLRERTAKLSDSLFQANHRLEHLASHDALTGLPNRRQLLERLQREIAAADQCGAGLAVLFVDLDEFKSINDAFGHSTGDAVLVRAATTISQLLGEGGFVARLGGDEFIVATRVASHQAAGKFAQTILSGLRVVPGAGREDVPRISASIGVAVFPADGMDASGLLAHADAAMYSVKQSGRNGVGFFTPVMREAVQARAQLAQELRGALERREFVLHFQPLVEAASGNLIGREALVRWQHPRLGLVMPDAFIGLAERLGLIGELGEWVLDEACRCWAQWRRDGFELASLSVNLSPQQLRDDALLEQVRHITQRHGLPEGVLTLEITESAAVLALEAGDAMLARLVGAGVRISIDDFGTGFSSLAYLAELPMHELKIDRRFVNRLELGGRHVAVVRSVIGLAAHLRLEVVAEGVETAAQAHILKEMGCSRLQGWHIGRPVPADDVFMHCC